MFPFLASRRAVRRLASKSSFGKLLLIVLAYALPIGLIIWLQWRTSERLEEIDPPPTPLESSVTSQDFRDRRAVRITPSYSTPASLLAPGWSGTVTAAPLTPGATVSTGTAVLQVDGIDRLAYAADAPFHRPLSLDATGPDVIQLREVLQHLDFLAGSVSSRTYDDTIADGVQRLARSVGVDATGETFDPAWLVWLPSEPFVVEHVEATVAAPAPSPGQPVVVAASQLLGIALTDTSNAELTDPAGAWTLSVGGTDLPLVDGRLDAGGLAKLDELTGPDAEPLSGELFRSDPRQALTVVASAVVAGADDHFCVWRRIDRSEPPDYGAQIVALGEGTASTVEIVSGLAAGDTYLVNPAEALDDATCP